MLNFFQKLKQKIQLKKQENSYEHLLKKYSLNDINFMSENKKVLILKHSSRCIVSQTVMKEFMKLYTSNTEKFYYIVVDVINNRALSNQISEHYKIIHQSPQVIIIQKGKCVYNESHEKINFNEVDKNF